MQISPEASMLNDTIIKSSLAVYSMLSKKGKAIYFPKKGILSQSADAKGKKYNATIGIAVEDDGSPMRLHSIEREISIKADNAFNYAPSFGRQDLREKWQKMIYEKNPSVKGKEISLPIVTNALTHGLSMAGYLFADPGDEVIMPDLYWENYELIFCRGYEASIKTFNMFKGIGLDLESMRKALMEGETGKRILLLNYPNNPSGYTPTLKEAQEIAEIVKESADKGNFVVVLADDSYFGLVYEEGIIRESIFSLLCDLSENVLAVKLDGATKEDYVWGFRVGFVSYGILNGTKELYGALEAKTAGAVRGNISNASNLSQSLLMKAYGSESYASEKKEKYEKIKTRYERVKQALSIKKYADYFSALPFNSGYFMCIKLKHNIDAEQLRQLLLKKYDTGAISQGNLLRIAFSAVSENKIAELFENIYNATAELDEKKALPKARMDKKSVEKLKKINNEHVERIINTYAELCKPSEIVVLDDSIEDRALIRKLAIEKNEESILKMEGHTIHFDGYNDQGRDLENTKVLVPEGVKLSNAIKTMEREQGLIEIHKIMDGIMQGATMYVKFYCLGPENSRFSISALQLTDSVYVLHSEDILYRQGYREFGRLNGSKNFFYFVHSQGRLTNNTSADVNQRRIYMDLEEERVFTVNNQYAGNSVGLKKLALRLAISKANKEDWLCEHMFIMGVHPKGKDRVSYFCGAFPTACGKTSTAMIPGQTIVGDDIAYIRPDEAGVARAANVEQGIFGIIQDINPKDDSVIYDALTTPREVIFSNVLVREGVPYWLGMGKELPTNGINYSGQWERGNKDSNGKEILAAHKNARYTIGIPELSNADPRADSPEGVPISGLIYGGRDSHTSVPVSQSLSWAHGVFTGAVIESETVAGTTEKEGIMKHNPMSNIEFLTVPLSVYIKNHLKFGEDLDKEPFVFSTNYFLKEDGCYLNEKVHKKVWVLWMEGRVHNEYEAIETPIGFIPKYKDLRDLFLQAFDKEYTEREYEQQFSIRISKILDKLERVEKIFKQEEDIPALFYKHLSQQRERLKFAQDKFGKDVVSPFEFERV